MGDIEVIKGVAMPAAMRRRRGSSFPFETMDVDGFFFLPDRTTEQFSSYACRWGRRLERTFRTRMMTMRKRKTIDGPHWEECEPDAKGAVEGVGVWRTA